jgi:hypothetical protein
MRKGNTISIHLHLSVGGVRSHIQIANKKGLKKINKKKKKKPDYIKYIYIRTIKIMFCLVPLKIKFTVSSVNLKPHLIFTETISAEITIHAVMPEVLVSFH